jgi:hypothetical protein
MAEKGGDTAVAGTGRAESDTLLLGNQELLEPLPLRWWTRHYMLAVYLVRSSGFGPPFVFHEEFEAHVFPSKPTSDLSYTRAMLDPSRIVKSQLKKPRP